MQLKGCKKDGLGEEKINQYGTLMKIIEYNNYNDIIIEFQDKYKARVHTQYRNFLLGTVRNPYDKTVFGVGMIGEKYSASVNKKITKEYIAWSGILERCFNENYKEKHLTYINAICCDEWLLYENFYEWLHSQENFDKWFNGNRWNIDKDILIKANKIYSPDTCCLVPNNVNNLFVKRDMYRGKYPLGVSKYDNGYVAYCNNPFINNKREYLGYYSTPEKAFNVYKIYKENLIKEIAQIEYSKNNITKQCFEAMINYEVEITD